MPPRELETLYGTSHFRVRIGRREIGFCEVGPLSSGTEWTVPDERPPPRFETVILRRALTRSQELYEWRRRILDGVDDRRQVTIAQLDGPGGEVVNAWQLIDAWPCRWTGPAFNALESALAFEELELVFDDLVWLPPDEGGGRRRPAKRTQGD